MKKKTVLITGASGDLGISLIQFYSKKNYSIIATVKNLKKKSKLLNKFKKNKNIFFFELDLSKEDSIIIKNLEKIIKNFTKIDALILNAGTIFNGLINFSSISNVKKLFQVNFFSNLLILQIFLKKLIISQGNIIFVSSTSAEDCPIGRMAYSASKSALNSLVKTAAKEFGRYKIRVNGIMPGLMDTKMMHSFTEKKIIDKYIENNSLRKVAKTSDVVRLINFLNSNQAKHINGQLIRVDGCHL